MDDLREEQHERELLEREYEEERREDDCACLEYGHGMLLTRVTSPSCPEHGS